LSDPTLLHEWRQCGGLETLMSYGLMPSLNPDRDEQLELAEAFRSALPKSHLDFFDNLKLSFIHRDFLFVHAGIRPGIPIEKQKETDLLWIRDEFLSCADPFGKFIVHGHTPVYAPDIRANRINIDTGAFATGRLTAIAIEGRMIVPLADNREWTSHLTKIGATRADELAFSI
jgi:serine/threonine protein phosphatase 1